MPRHARITISFYCPLRIFCQSHPITLLLLPIDFFSCTQVLVPVPLQNQLYQVLSSHRTYLLYSSYLLPVVHTNWLSVGEFQHLLLNSNTQTHFHGFTSTFGSRVGPHLPGTRQFPTQVLHTTTVVLLGLIPGYPLVLPWLSLSSVILLSSCFFIRSQPRTSYNQGHPDLFQAERLCCPRWHTLKISFSHSLRSIPQVTRRDSATLRLYTQNQ